MSLQNRVLPTGEITAQPWRGTLMGNRGILHNDQKTLETRRWQHPHWVTCVLTYKDWHRPVMTPRNYTELFFLDEACALAAGHRPCGLCRHSDYTRFRAAWAAAHGDAPLEHDDRMLHAARVNRTRQQIRHEADFAILPDGVFVWHNDAPHLVWGSRLVRCEGGQYHDGTVRPISGIAEVLTPAPTLAAMARGYRPVLHPRAQAFLHDA